MSQTIAKTAAAPSLCQGCVNWQLFQGKCWFFWDAKQECSQYRLDNWGNTQHKTVRQRFDVF
ncbi:MAG TPA: hypothetical protein VJK52_01355 [Candidatus Nanoarchaeia archaeon]|nr:hypothetical protein [Candidatus Nanoarchaeia archaeon]